jgi:inner membrane protein
MLFFGHLGITLLIVFVVFYFLKESMDYRFVMVGALLPDMLDKPIGDYILYSVFQNGRIFGHTLLFVFALTVVGAYVTKKYKANFVELLALGSLIHIAEDQVWKAPGTLFWPLFGLEFPKYDLENYMGQLLYALFHNPDAYVPEIIGITIFAVFFLYFRMYKPENIRAFITSGILYKQARAAAAPLDI